MCNIVEKILETVYSTVYLFSFWLTVFVLRELLSSYVYLLYIMCICMYYVCITVLTLDAGLLARNYYP